MAPREPKIIEEKEKTPAPHKRGIKLPTKEPAMVQIQIKALEFISLNITQITHRLLQNPQKKQAFFSGGG